MILVLFKKKKCGLAFDWVECILHFMHIIQKAFIFLCFIFTWLYLSEQIMYAEQWGVESSILPTIIHNGRTDTMDVAPTDESSVLVYYNTEKHKCNNQNGIRVLQAGTPLGLMAYLYSRYSVHCTCILNWEED